MKGTFLSNLQKNTRGISKYVTCIIFSLDKKKSFNPNRLCKLIQKLQRLTSLPFTVYLMLSFWLLDKRGFIQITKSTFLNSESAR